MSPPRCRPSGPKTIIRLRRPSKNRGGIVHLCCPSKKPQLHHSPAPPRREARGTSGAGRRRRSPANDLRGPSTSRDGSSFICTVGSERPSTRAPGRRVPRSSFACATPAKAAAAHAARVDGTGRPRIVCAAPAKSNRRFFPRPPTATTARRPSSANLHAGGLIPTSTAAALTAADTTEEDAHDDDPSDAVPTTQPIAPSNDRTAAAYLCATIGKDRHNRTSPAMASRRLRCKFHEWRYEPSFFVHGQITGPAMSTKHRLL